MVSVRLPNEVHAALLATERPIARQLVDAARLWLALKSGAAGRPLTHAEWQQLYLQQPAAPDPRAMWP